MSLAAKHHVVEVPSRARHDVPYDAAIRYACQKSLWPFVKEPYDTQKRPSDMLSLAVGAPESVPEPG